MRNVKKLDPKALSYVMVGGGAVLLAFMSWVFYRAHYDLPVLCLLATAANAYHMVARSISKLPEKDLSAEALRSEITVILAFGVMGGVASLGVFLVYVQH